MILRAKPSDVAKHRNHTHQPRQCGHFDCLWGYSNPKHRPHSSNVLGKRQRRKLRSTLGTGYESKRAA